MKNTTAIAIITFLAIALFAGFFIGLYIQNPTSSSAPTEPPPTQTPTQTSEPLNPSPTPTPSPSWGLVWEYKADDEIEKVAISPDGGYLIAASCHDLLFLTKEKQLLWEKNEADLYSQNGADSINDVAITKNGNYMAIGADVFWANSTFLLSRDNAILWEKNMGDNYAYVSATFDGEYFAIANSYVQKSYIRLYDRVGTELWNWTLLGYPTCVSISEYGDYIVAADDEKYIYLFSRSGNVIWDIKLEEYSIPFFQSVHEGVYVSISQDGSVIGVGIGKHIGLLSRDGQWILAPTETEEYLEGFSISGNGEFIFTAEGKTTRIYNSEGNLTSSFEVKEDITDVHNTPDGRYLVIGSKDMRIYFLEKS